MAARSRRRTRESNRSWPVRRLFVLAPLVVGALGLGWWLGGQRGGEAVSEPVAAAASRVPSLHPRVVATYPHDTGASTQGLLWFEGRLYESTGPWGSSTLRRVQLESGEVESRVELSPMLFGEGLARVGRELVQLTWRSGLALRYELDSLARVGEHAYSGEGWGLCFDGDVLWRSDGSATLHRHDARDFAELGTVAVRLDGSPVTNLNELECAEGWVYANVWQTDDIVRIDAATGAVTAVVDASSLTARLSGRNVGVLNGIAYRQESQTFLLTGKNWPTLFEVVLVPEPAIR